MRSGCTAPPATAPRSPRRSWPPHGRRVVAVDDDYAEHAAAAGLPMPPRASRRDGDESPCLACSAASAPRSARRGPAAASTRVRSCSTSVSRRRVARRARPKARHIPLSRPRPAPRELPLGRQIITVCRSGTRSARAAGILAVALLMVLSTLVVAGPLLARFPKAALGALVIFAAVRLIDVGELRRIARFRRSELLLAVVTTIAVLGVGVSTASWWPWHCRSSIYCAGSLTHMTGSSGTCRESPACTTSTITRRPARFPAWSSTATTRRCVSPTRRISANGP